MRETGKNPWEGGIQLPPLAIEGLRIKRILSLDCELQNILLGLKSEMLCTTRGGCVVKSQLIENLQTWSP